MYIQSFHVTALFDSAIQHNS